MRNRINRLLGSGVLLAALLVSGQAQATVFTLDAVVAFSLLNRAEGTLNPVGDPITGDIDYSLLDGIVSFSIQDVFIVDVTLSGSSDDIDAIGFTVRSP